jgi:hypothetical protein
VSNQDYDIKRLLGIYKNKTSINLDNYAGIELSNKSRQVEPDQNVHIVNSNDRFNEERNSSGIYRISGKLDIMSSNIYSQAFNNFPSEDDWDPTIVDSNLVTKNWVLQITYPFENDPNLEIVSKEIDGDRISVAERGLQIKSITKINITGGIDQILLRTVQNHGVSEIGEYVYITPDEYLLSYLGIHKVIGFEIGNEDKGLILETTYQGDLFRGNVKRVFEPSLEDTLFLNNTNVQVISRCDSNGDSVLFDHTKIYSNNHDIRIGEWVDIRFNNFNGMNGVFKVVAVPNNNEFVIKYNFPTSEVVPFNITTLYSGAQLKYKVLNGMPSNYYFRKFKILTNLNDYEVYKCGFSTNIFSDDFSNKLSLFHFDKNIDVTDLTDNLNRPLSELYVTITKRSNPFGDVTSLMEANSDVVPLNSYMGPIILHTLSYWDSSGEGTIQYDKDDLIYGDFVEYNEAFLSEKTLTKIINRFGVTRVDDSNNYTSDGQGYYYYQHNKIQIRKFSSVIETVDNKPDELYPSYAQINYDGTVSWRDILDIGYFEDGINGVDYPFVNGCHYLFDNYTIYIRSQLPTNFIDVDTEQLQYVKTKTSSSNGPKC